MKRALPGEIRKRFYRREIEPIADELRACIEDCASALTLALKDTRPDLVPELNDRQNDIAEPLLAIAELAGDGWPENLRGFLRELFQSEDETEQSLGIRLLTDLREIFAIKEGAPPIRLASADVVRALRELPDSPWPDWRGKGITGHALARILRSFRIMPVQWWGGKPVRGYESAQFEDAWRRYCQPSPLHEGGQLGERENQANQHVEKQEPPTLPL